jgi:hypothetical protein
VKGDDVKIGTGIFGSFWFWIVFLIVPLIGFNVAAGFAYIRAHPEDELSVQLWSYIASGTFKVITISLFLPLLLLVLERRWNLADSIRRDLTERLNRQAARREEMQWECVNETSKMWSDLQKVVGRVPFYPHELDEPTRYEGVFKQILKELHDLRFAVTEKLNMWQNRFEFKLEEAKLMGRFPNLLVEYTEDVVRYVLDEREPTKDQFGKYKSWLHEMSAGLRRGAYYDTLNALKLKIRLMSSETLGDSGEEAGRIRRDLTDAMESLGIVDDLIRKAEAENKIFPTVEEDGVETLREEGELFFTWKRQNSAAGVFAYDRLDEFRESYKAVQFKRNVGELLHECPRTSMQPVAKLMGFDFFVHFLEARAESDPLPTEMKEKCKLDSLRRVLGRNRGPATKAKP